MDRPTAEQEAALDRFAVSWGHGRRPNWKAVLRRVWEDGVWPACVLDADVPLLQQVRNTLGPRWLERYVPNWKRGRAGLGL